MSDTILLFLVQIWNLYNNSQNKIDIIYSIIV